MSPSRGGHLIAQDPAHRRRSIRLQGYDYSQAGAYFVTICTQDRACLFGEILEGKLDLNEAGRRIDVAWRGLPDHYPSVEVDAAVVMPNHFHGLVILRGTGSASKPFSLSDLVHRFKSLTTRFYSDGVEKLGWPAYPGRLWQRNFYERIVRGPEEMNRLRQYIVDNPIRWQSDPENPNRSGV
jgi:putative transposase